MSLLWLEGFEDGLHTAPGGFVGSRWFSTFNTINSSYPVGRTGYGLARRGLDNVTDNWMVKQFTPAAKAVVGFGWREETAWSTSPTTNLVAFFTTSGSVKELGLRRTATGDITMWRNLTQIAATAGPVLSPNVWHYIELSVVLHATTGRAIVKVDGVVVIDFTGNTLGGSQVLIDVVKWGIWNLGYITVDDIYLLNGLGSAPNNDFLGDIVVENLMPNGNGTFSQLLGSDGNSVDNFLLVDEVSLGGGGTDYAGGVAEGLMDTYAMADVSTGSTQIFGMQVTTYNAKSEAGNKLARRVLRRGGVNYFGPSSNLSNTYTTKTDIVETDPSTGVAWVKAGVDAMELGMEVRNS